MAVFRLILGVLLAAGFGVWWRPSVWTGDWPRLMVVTAALVLVPLGMEAIDRRTEWRARALRDLWRVTAWACLPAGAALAYACTLPAGEIAAPWVLPWAAVALTAAATVLAGRRGLWGATGLTLGAAPVQLVVGAGGMVFDRFGWQAFGFDVDWTLMIGVHFTFAGFVACVAAGGVLQAVGRGGDVRAVNLGVLGGVPAVALGIFGTRAGLPAALELLGALTLIGGVAWVAVLHLRAASRRWMGGWARLCVGLAGCCVLGGMVLAVGFALRAWWAPDWLHLPFMWRWHGTLNALGFGLPAMLAWGLGTQEAPGPGHAPRR